MSDENNKLVIKRNWRGKITEIELQIKKEEPDRKPILEFLNVVDAVFCGEREV